MGKRLIKPVENNNEKEVTYRTMKGRYKKAMDEEFYFEALFIDYAMIEDRLRSFIYHIGGLNNRKSFLLDNDCSKQFLLMLYNQYTNRHAKTLNIGNISTKYNLVRAILNWVCTSIGFENKYQSVLKNVCESLDIDDVINCLNELEKWCGYRNELVHALMNKNMNSVNSELSEKVVEGMKLATRIDTYVRIVKKDHKIRRAINLLTE